MRNPKIGPYNYGLFNRRLVESVQQGAITTAERHTYLLSIQHFLRRLSAARWQEIDLTSFDANDVIAYFRAEKSPYAEPFRDALNLVKEMPLPTAGSIYDQQTTRRRTPMPMPMRTPRPTPPAKPQSARAGVHKLGIAPPRHAAKRPASKVAGAKTALSSAVHKPINRLAAGEQFRFKGMDVYTYFDDLRQASSGKERSHYQRLADAVRNSLKVGLGHDWPNEGVTHAGVGATLVAPLPARSEQWQLATRANFRLAIQEFEKVHGPLEGDLPIADFAALEIQAASSAAHDQNVGNCLGTP